MLKLNKKILEQNTNVGVKDIQQKTEKTEKPYNIVIIDEFGNKRYITNNANKDILPTLSITNGYLSTKTFGFNDLKIEWDCY